MKRSEMLINIRRELLHKQIEPNFEETILSVVEKLGMLPPEVVSNLTHPEIYFENIWEPE